MKLFSKIAFLVVLVGLIASCKPSGEKVETSEAGEVSAVDGNAYSVDVAGSSLLWEGTKVTGKHNGTVNIQSGEVVLNEGDLVAGNFVIDMTTITDLDLEGDMKNNLENHLKGTVEGKENDFFNVNQYPTAKFEITNATKLMNNEDANYIVTGNLTIRDITKQISFRALVEENEGMVSVSTPPFVIDRTEWGIQFRSTKFFDDLKDNAIMDDFGLQVNLVAK